MPPHLHRRPPLRQPMPTRRRLLLLPPHHPPPGPGPAHPRRPLRLRPPHARRPRRHPTRHRRDPPPHRPQRDRLQPSRSPPLRPPDRQHQPTPPSRQVDTQIRREEAPQPIEEITTDPEQGLLAPAAEFTQPERPRSVMRQLLDRFAAGKPHPKTRTPNPPHPTSHRRKPSNPIGRRREGIPNLREIRRAQDRAPEAAEAGEASSGVSQGCMSRFWSCGRP